MKKFVLVGLLAAGFSASVRSADVGVSIHVAQPGVYGRIDIGNFPPPAVILPQPVIVSPQPVVVQQQPVYLYVPPGHQKNWAKYCGRYRACGEPVYFVQENWVRERYEERHRDDTGGHGPKEKKHKDKGKDKHDKD